MAKNSFNDLSALKDLSKQLHKKEKEEGEKAVDSKIKEAKARKASSQWGISRKDTHAMGHTVLPDGSNATAEDYFRNSDAFIEDKFSDERMAPSKASPKKRTEVPTSRVAADGSNATIEDYFGDGEAFIEDKGEDFRKRSSSRKSSKYLTVDLHMNAITHPADLPKNKCLEYQMAVFRRVMEENAEHKGKEIIFIHGDGDGILRKAIIDELDEVYWKSEYRDAPFHEFGMGGAIVVKIR